MDLELDFDFMSFDNSSASAEELQNDAQNEILMGYPLYVTLLNNLGYMKQSLLKRNKVIRKLQSSKQVVSSQLEKTKADLIVAQSDVERFVDNMQLLIETHNNEVEKLKNMVADSEFQKQQLSFRLEEITQANRSEVKPKLKANNVSVKLPKLKAVKQNYATVSCQTDLCNSKTSKDFSVQTDLYNSSETSKDVSVQTDLELEGCPRSVANSELGDYRFLHQLESPISMVSDNGDFETVSTIWSEVPEVAYSHSTVQTPAQCLPFSEVTETGNSPEDLAEDNHQAIVEAQTETSRKELQNSMFDAIEENENLQAACSVPFIDQCLTTDICRNLASETPLENHHMSELRVSDENVLGIQRNQRIPQASNVPDQREALEIPITLQAISPDISDKPLEDLERSLSPQLDKCEAWPRTSEKGETTALEGKSLEESTSLISSKKKVTKIVSRALSKKSMLLASLFDTPDEEDYQAEENIPSIVEGTSQDYCKSSRPAAHLASLSRTIEPFYDKPNATLEEEEKEMELILSEMSSLPPLIQPLSPVVHKLKRKALLTMDHGEEKIAKFEEDFHLELLDEKLQKIISNPLSPLQTFDYTEGETQEPKDNGFQVTECQERMNVEKSEETEGILNFRKSVLSGSYDLGHKIYKGHISCLSVSTEHFCKGMLDDLFYNAKIMSVEVTPEILSRAFIIGVAKERWTPLIKDKPPFPLTLYERRSIFVIKHLEDSQERWANLGVTVIKEAIKVLLSLRRPKILRAQKDEKSLLSSLTRLISALSMLAKEPHYAKGLLHYSCLYLPNQFPTIYKTLFTTWPKLLKAGQDKLLIDYLWHCSPKESRLELQELLKSLLGKNFVPSDHFDISSLNDLTLLKPR
ncbi:uncharacterized protein LOC132204173 [Neocloeon triangulifer]|uniref:uncharacterized protein LOC132204173 n=1 Tax=Neocloeon triangulifer TaxID=2078957 RepID=UPI00286F245A|nr:uncharacterized protein LOC132204173 [Neocloeon triangulifer]XP_059488481.1 uncharacterized protein LOC132204173 [Neocloeon triangulifer]